MSAGAIGNDVGVVLVGLHFTPGRWIRAWSKREIAEELRVLRIGDLDERHAVGASDKRELATAARMRPAPVATEAGPARVVHGDHVNGQERDELCIFAVEHLRLAI